MTYQLSSLDLANVNALFNQQNYAAMYNYIADIIEANNATNQVDSGIVPWLRMAAKINSDDGSWISEYVRNYTFSAASANGTPITEADFQNASNLIAAGVNNLINNPKNIMPAGTIPSAADIVEVEVVDVVENTLGLQDDDWAGTLMAEFFFGYNAVDAYVDTSEEAFEQLFRMLIIGAGTTEQFSVAVIADYLSDLWDLFDDAEASSSPLVLDLDGDGIELINVNSSDAVYWDIDLDGFAEASGWVKGDDGLLAIDLNNDGIINNSSELFGDQTGHENGFLALAAYDSNNDGLITSTDVEWENLIVWRDMNGNGYSESAEQFSLDSLLITQINLGYTDVNYTIAGNAIKQSSTFTMNGSTRTIVDAYFAYNDANSIYDGDVEYTADLFDLPLVRGYGVVPDLYTAMALDNDVNDPDSLKSLVNALHDKSFANLFNDTDEIWNDVRDIMFRWAGVDDVDPDSRDTYNTGIDARVVEFIEAFLDRNYLQKGFMTDPGSQPSRMLNEAFHIAQKNIYARLLVQSAGGELFEGDWYYDITTDSIKGITGIDAVKLAELEILSGSMVDKLTYWQNIVRMVEYTIGVNNLTSSDTNDLNAAIYNSDNSLSLVQVAVSLNWQPALHTTINGTSGNDNLTGTNSHDTINAGYGNDIVNGGIGDDTIDAGDGDDILNGQIGSDIILGRGGNDTYIYELGHGHDVYRESGSGIDKILFGAGITSDHITTSRVNGYDMLIQIDTGTVIGSIVIENQFYVVAGGGAIEIIEFYDSSTIDLFSLSFTTYGTSGNDRIQGVHGSRSSGQDTIYGGDGHDTINAYAPNELESTPNWLYGEAGNDKLNGGRGNDVLDGGDGDDIINADSGDDHIYMGAGNDRATGGAGNDTYYYNLNGGFDILSETGGGSDLIVFGAGIEEEHLSYGRSGNDLIININTGENTGSITIRNQFHIVAGGGYIELAQFSDMSTLDLADLQITTYGTDGNDIIWGVHSARSTGRDVIYAGAGDDYVMANAGNEQDYEQNWLYGEAGNDTLNGARGNDALDGGDGDDTLHGNQGDDILIGGAGNDIARGGSGNDVYHYLSGHDIYQESSGVDQILLDASWNGIVPEYHRYVRDLHIVFDVNNSIFINDFYRDAGYVIESMVYEDATQIDLRNIAYTAHGTDGNNTVTGTAWDDTLYGYEGNDTLNAGAGNDILYGGVGNDILNGEAGNDTLYGGDGDDTLNGGAGDDLLYGEDGIDTLSYAGASAGVVIDISLSDAQNTGGAGIDTISGFENITGSSHNDILKGSSGNNRIDGGNGNDIIDGGAGDDVLIGGAGTDTLTYETAGAAVEVNLSVATAQNTGGSGTDTISTFENLTGSNYNDTLRGSTAVNVIRGGDGSDSLYGNAGNDTLYGDAGDDILYGEAGNDILYGGSGADTFKFTAGGGSDTIKDFSLAEGDILGIAALLTGFDPLTSVITDFVQITTSGANSIVRVDANGLTGGTAWTQIAVIEGVTGLTDEAALRTSGNLVV